jgi:hypothetical protein
VIKDLQVVGRGLFNFFVNGLFISRYFWTLYSLCLILEFNGQFYVVCMQIIFLTYIRPRNFTYRRYAPCSNLRLIPMINSMSNNNVAIYRV